MFENRGIDTCRCRQPDIHECKTCHISYCPICDDNHWVDCKSFEVTFSDDSGAFLKTARDVFPGEIVFSELPLVVGPKLPPKDGFVPCVGCCRPLSSENFCLCPECSWPACSPQCEDLKNEKTHAFECQVLKLQRSEIPTKNFRFEVLLPLRILFLQKTNRTEWQKLVERMVKKRVEQLENSSTSKSLTHNDENLEFLDNNILTPLKKLEEDSQVVILEEKSEELLQEIFNFVKTNTLHSEEDILVQIPPFLLSLVQHSCLPNCFLTTAEQKITIRANSFISKNTPIIISYTPLFQGTCERLQDLKTKNLFCSCNRCKDPTEFETFFSALKCLEPCGGTQLPSDPLNPQTLWVCDSCKIELPNDQMLKFVKHLGREVDKVFSKNVTIDDLEEFLAKLLMFLHPNHFYVCQIKYKLIKMYNTEDVQMTKAEICRGLIEILRKFYQNGGTFFGELIYEYFVAKLTILRGGSNGENKNFFEEDVQDIKDLLEEMKRNVEFNLELKFCGIVTQAEEMLNDWLNQMSK